jgi:hypothetical protein
MIQVGCQSAGPSDTKKQNPGALGVVRNRNDNANIPEPDTVGDRNANPVALGVERRTFGPTFGIPMIQGGCQNRCPSETKKPNPPRSVGFYHTRVVLFDY